MLSTSPNLTGTPCPPRASRACWLAGMTFSHGIGRPGGIKRWGRPAPTDDTVS